MSTKVTINGVSYETTGSGSIRVDSSGVHVDGKKMDTKDAFESKKIKVVVEGDVEGDLDVAGSAEVKGKVEGDVDAGGSVECGDVGKSIDVGGSIECKNVGGSVAAGGSVTCGKVGGGIAAGGSVTRR